MHGISQANTTAHWAVTVGWVGALRGPGEVFVAGCVSFTHVCVLLLVAVCSDGITKMH